MDVSVKTPTLICSERGTISGKLMDACRNVIFVSNDDGTCRFIKANDSNLLGKTLRLNVTVEEIEEDVDYE